MRSRVIIPTLMAAALAIALPAVPSFAADAAPAASTAPATDTGSITGKVDIANPEKVTIRISHEIAEAPNSKAEPGHRHAPRTDGKAIEVKPKADGTYEAKDLKPGLYFVLALENKHIVARYPDTKVEAGQATTLDIKANVTKPGHKE